MLHARVGLFERRCCVILFQGGRCVCACAVYCEVIEHEDTHGFVNADARIWRFCFDHARLPCWFPKCIGLFIKNVADWLD